MKNTLRLAASTIVLSSGLGLAGLAAAAVAEAHPAPFPAYHWCPGDRWDPGWGNNWDGGRCHDDGYYDGEPRDHDHWHGYGDWHPDNGWGPGGPGWGPGGPGWHDDHGWHP